MAQTSENSLQSNLWISEPPWSPPPRPSTYPQDFRLFLSGNSSVSVGGNGTIFGSPDEDIVHIGKVPGAVILDASFNRGGDLIDLPYAAKDWFIERNGSTVIFDNFDTQVIIPVGTSGIWLKTGDEIRLLAFDRATGDIMLGDQVVHSSLTVIYSEPFDGIWLGPDSFDESSVQRLFLLPDSETTVSAMNVHITGSNEADHVIFQSGTATFDASFNRGGDIVTLLANATDVTASLTGSSVHLKAIGPNAHFDLTIPVGSQGLTLDFADGDRTLIYSEGQFRIGDQVITGDPSALFAFA